jgi:hypothetical protein
MDLLKLVFNDSQPPTAKTLGRQLLQIDSLISKVETHLFGDSENLFEIGSVTRNSPPRVEMIRTGNEARADRSLAFILDTLESIDAGKQSSFDDLEVLKAFRIDSDSLQIEYKSRSHATSPKFAKNLAQMLSSKRQVIYQEVIQGVLKGVDIHGKQTFKIYPDFGPKVVQCIVEDDQLESIRLALGKDVEVTGMATAKGPDCYPHTIVVENIQILPPVDTEFDWKSLKGSVASEALGGLDSVAFVRKQRDEGW